MSDGIRATIFYNTIIAVYYTPPPLVCQHLLGRVVSVGHKNEPPLYVHTRACIHLYVRALTTRNAYKSPDNSRFEGWGIFVFHYPFSE